MSSLTALLSGGWQLLAGLAAVVAALLASYFGGRKIGKTQEKAKADTAAAQKEASQVAAVAKKQRENIEEAKRVQTANDALNDGDARSRLQQSKYNRP